MENSKSKLWVTITVIVVIVLVVGGIVLFGKKKPSDSDTTSSSSTPNTLADNNTSTTPSNAAFKDGTYKATGSYDSPGGTQSITITVTLKDGVITDTSAQEGANDPTAQQHQDEFVGGYKQLVVGKKITAVKLSRV